LHSSFILATAPSLGSSVTGYQIKRKMSFPGEVQSLVQQNVRIRLYKGVC
jgi:hypothetical protein